MVAPTEDIEAYLGKSSRCDEKRVLRLRSTAPCDMATTATDGGSMELYEVNEAVAVQVLVNKRMQG
jgi:hypothetical protein